VLEVPMLPAVVSLTFWILELFLHPVKMVIARLSKCYLTAVHDIHNQVHEKSP
jgi:hypothetical protein